MMSSKNEKDVPLDYQMETDKMKNMKLNTHKAGMEGLDTDRINEIILEASKGSKYYIHKQKRQKEIEEKLASLKTTAKNLRQSDIDDATKQVDQFIMTIENTRDVSKIIVHIDMDAFYAAVEMRDNPSLKDQPMAVGSLGMLSTSNYMARKFGVRAAMPGFIGKKLCPQLVLVRPNFTKYTAVSQEVQEVLASYDPHFNCVGLDEAYLDLTEHVNSVEESDKSRFEIAADIVNEIRLAIFKKTSLTASAGIASNMLLAKIASDMNKPNGQFVIEPDVAKIKQFAASLSIRKIWGIGPVSEQQLNALQIKTCQDILDNRGLIHLLFSSISSKFFIEASLGIGRTNVKSDHVRKSISVEETFAEMHKPDDLLAKCQDLCQELVDDMRKHEIKGKTVTLKLKTVNFQIKTRSSSVPEYSCDLHMISKIASKLLKTEMENASPHPLKLRLMGMRMSNLKPHGDKKQRSLLDSFANEARRTYPKCPVCFKEQQTDDMSEINKHIDACLGIECHVDEPNVMKVDAPTVLEDAKQSYECPICRAHIPTDLKGFNSHIDSCLNGNAIKEILKSENQTEITSRSPTKLDAKVSDSNRKKKTIDSFFKCHTDEASTSTFKHEAKQRHETKHPFKNEPSTSNERIDRNKVRTTSPETVIRDRKHRSSSRSRSKKCKHRRSRSRSRDRKRKRTKSDDNNDERKTKYEAELPREESENDDIEPAEVYSDPDFRWNDYKRTLVRMFFLDNEYIKRNSKELDDFWGFLMKYQRMQKKRIASGGSRLLGSIPTTPNFQDLNDIPDNFIENLMAKYKISTLKESCQDLYFRVHMYDVESQQTLPKDRIEEFRYVIRLYLSFCTKQEYGRVKTLRTSQQNLPIAQYRQEILRTVSKHQVVVIAGDTGCGKSTQVPQYLLRAGFTNIACTQPRRIACISLSKRVAFETLNEYKSEVGYQIRFDKNKTQHTRILFLTEGLLLRQVCSDTSLSTYNVVVLDEVHERHLHGDFLLGVIKCLIHNRSDLKIVLMSATINIDLFTKYFYNAPVIQVPGRLYPIKINYRPISEVEKKSKSSRIDPDPYVRILQLIDQTITETEHGDVLIFLSGMAEISSVADAASAYAEQTKRWIILPLHSTLSIADQDKVFDVAPAGVRKCVISTNIAETSITIDGIRFVVDSGKVKEMNYDTACKMQKLQEFWISRASAEQRKGRAGRTGPGVCYRLYSEADYNEMAAYSTPEIQRVPLDSLILQMLSMGLPDPRKFPFIQKPPDSSIENAVTSLIEHGALTMNEGLTPMGNMLSRLPVDISIGKMLIMGSLFKMSESALSLASALSIQCPFTNNSFKDPGMMTARKQFESDHGDPITLLNAYNEWLNVKSGNENSRKWCRRFGIEEQRFYELTKLRNQFKDLLMSCKFLENKEADRTGSSSERSKRHGEMKQLRKMKFSYHNAPRKRKMLKLNYDYEIGDGAEDDNDDEIDIKDVEFRMSHDNKHVRELCNLSASVSSADISILKVIVCSGLFPQIALADDHNSYKSDSEQLFHTKLKPYVVLHPMGVFANDPEILHVKDATVARTKEFAGRGKLSHHHQLLTYVSLLETTKPYLMTTMRVSACHTLLLFSNSLDTNKDFSRIVSDGWLELQISEADEAQRLVLNAIEIRDIWAALLKKKLEENEDSNFDARKLEQQLSGELIEFYHQTQSHYTIRRLLAADIKNLYVGPSESEDVEAVSELFNWITDLKPNTVKGGVYINNYLTYNCLNEADVEPMKVVQKLWKCDHCEQEMMVTVLDKLRHESECFKKKSAQTNEDSESGFSTSNVIKRPFFCPDCQEELHLTSVQILKHRKTHSLVNK